MTDQTDSPKFIFVSCQYGAEAAARAEILAAHPEIRLAFSRPGFVTFKLNPDNVLPEKFHLKSTLARTWGWCLGSLKNDDAENLVNELVSSNDLSSFNGLHVWQRDSATPGHRGFEPGLTVLANEVANLLDTKLGSDNRLPTNSVGKPDDRIFDVMLVEPNQWWLGYHYATTNPGRWPGGVPKIDTNIEVVSRAYFKTQEALLWLGIQLGDSDTCVEIGSAPGGSCQFLLETGAKVIGIDPAEMEPEILEHPNFTYIRRRGHEVKKRDLKSAKWLFADLNIVPKYTFDTVSEIVNSAHIDLRGMFLTMKLTDWKMVEQIPRLMQQVRELGFGVVKARQLAFNRREFCLAVVKDKYMLRANRKK